VVKEMKIKATSKIKCLHCGDIIQSKSIHDFVTCSCGRTSLDGGLEYTKISSTSLADFEDCSDFKDVRDGTVLFTKDGRRIGNAVVFETNNESATVLTDFGNTKSIRLNELTRYFYIGETKPLSDWLTAHQLNSLAIKVYQDMTKSNKEDICSDCDSIKNPKCNNCIGE